MILTDIRFVLDFLYDLSWAYNHSCLTNTMHSHVDSYISPALVDI